MSRDDLAHERKCVIAARDSLEPEGGRRKGLNPIGVDRCAERDRGMKGPRYLI